MGAQENDSAALVAAEAHAQRCASRALALALGAGEEGKKASKELARAATVALAAAALPPREIPGPVDATGAASVQPPAAAHAPVTSSTGQRVMDPGVGAGVGAVHQSAYIVGATGSQG